MQQRKAQRNDARNSRLRDEKKTNNSNGTYLYDNQQLKGMMMNLITLEYYTKRMLTNIMKCKKATEEEKKKYKLFKVFNEKSFFCYCHMCFVCSKYQKPKKPMLKL